MKLNTIKPAEGSKKDTRRVGRGTGSGFGKTAGRGHKGQKSRTGGFHKVGFEGGQMPIQRRLPKRGFKSVTKQYNATVRTGELAKLKTDVVDLLSLKEAKLISNLSQNAKIFLSGEVTKKFKVQGIHLSKGAKKAIESAGGVVEVLADPEEKTIKNKLVVKDVAAKKPSTAKKPAAAKKE